VATALLGDAAALNRRPRSRVRKVRTAGSQAQGTVLDNVKAEQAEWSQISIRLEFAQADGKCNRKIPPGFLATGVPVRVKWCGKSAPRLG